MSIFFFIFFLFWFHQNRFRNWYYFVFGRNGWWNVDLIFLIFSNLLVFFIELAKFIVPILETGLNLLDALIFLWRIHLQICVLWIACFLGFGRCILFWTLIRINFNGIILIIFFSVFLLNLLKIIGRTFLLHYSRNLLCHIILLSSCLRITFFININSIGLECEFSFSICCTFYLTCCSLYWLICSLYWLICSLLLLLKHFCIVFY